MQELISNDRVIGGITPACSARAVDLYKTFVTGECVVASGPRVAEMAKLTENSFRDVNIAFANELSIVSSSLGIDVWELIALANRHPRVDVLRPGTGVGGHCIAVDPWFIVSSAPEETKLIRTAREVNDFKPQWLLDKIRIALADHLLKNPTCTAKDVAIACFGLAFKPNIDDLRESPAMQIVSDLANFHTGPVFAIEPNIKRRPTNLPKNVSMESVESASQKMDIAVFLVAHQDFKDKGIGNWGSALIIDACGLTNSFG